MVPTPLFKLHHFSEELIEFNLDNFAINASFPKVFINSALLFLFYLSIIIALHADDYTLLVHFEIHHGVTEKGHA